MTRTFACVCRRKVATKLSFQVVMVKSQHLLCDGRWLDFPHRDKGESGDRAKPLRLLRPFSMHRHGGVEWEAFVCSPSLPPGTSLVHETAKSWIIAMPEIVSGSLRASRTVAAEPAIITLDGESVPAWC